MSTFKGGEKSKWRGGQRIAGRTLTWNSSRTEHTIASATIHSFKGLESLVVILTALAEPDTNLMRQLSYVGSSRAKSHLIFIRAGKLDKLQTSA